MQRLRSSVLILFILALSGCARSHVPAGSEYAMAAVLLRYELSMPLSYLGANRNRCPCFVSVADNDPPQAWLAALATTGVRFLPASTWHPGDGIRIRIGPPRSRWNGNFDVALSYDCGLNCAKASAALLRYNGRNWRVIEAG
jgi:hypothetical protein